MCFAVKCNNCGKTHVEQVMKDVPKEQQCECPREGSGLLCIVQSHDMSTPTLMITQDPVA
ncbi:hypothetical protein BGW42_003698 [Actinomortierella wolfii]|nr:hypothetical protein BGW42_003698 [Actinomortierella wolfii]